jgi:F-type H+-transporting ATPase subunit a
LVTDTSGGIVAAVEYGGEWGLPDNVNELFSFPPIPFTEGWELFGASVEVDRGVLMILASTVILGAFFWLGVKDRKVVPDKLQSLIEMFVEFIREQIAIPSIGPHGNAFVPFLTTLFAFIFLNNFFKITPFVMLPPTARMGVPALLAVVVLITFIVVGIRTHGLLTYLKNAVIPPGVPLFAYLVVIPIELVSNFIIRPLTLAIRLFGNMVAGHLLVVITLITIHAFLTVGLFGEPLQATTAIGVLALLLSPVVFAFELMVVSLQAFIFTILTAVYIGLAMEEH